MDGGMEQGGKEREVVRRVLREERGGRSMDAMKEDEAVYRMLREEQGKA
jgi:hypothetical protein